MCAMREQQRKNIDFEHLSCFDVWCVAPLRLQWFEFGLNTRIAFNCTGNCAINLRHQLFLPFGRNFISRSSHNLFKRVEQINSKTIELHSTAICSCRGKSNPKRNFVHLKIIYARVHAVRRSIGPSSPTKCESVFHSLVPVVRVLSNWKIALQTHTKTDTINCMRDAFAAVHFDSTIHIQTI